ncbi:MAG: hypothetical protein RIR39_2098 [Pseudomonadota bacterium]
MGFFFHHSGKNHKTDLLPLRKLSRMNATITGLDIQEMVQHWLQTPVYGYYGSDYGQDVKSLLQKAQNDGKADEFIAKMKADIPVLQALPSGSINIYAVTSGIDKLEIVVEVAGTAFTVGGI